jgi:hypothetical protein
VKSNGIAGSVTFTWYYVNSDRTRVTVGDPSTVTVAAGKTDQTVTSPSFDFGPYEDFYPNWGVEVTSSPGAQSGASPQLLTSTNGCQPVIQ